MTVDDRSSLLDKPPQDTENSKESSALKISKFGLTTLFLAAFLAAADETFVLSTSSDIASSLGLSKLSSWLLTGYNLGYMMALPLYGRLCEITGCRRMLIFSYAVYGLGCIATATAPTVYVAIAGRFISGCGGSGMTDLTAVILKEIATPRQAATLRSYISTSSMIGVTCGAPLGGAITSWIGWRWSFLAHVPPVIICIVVGYLTLPSDKAQSPQVSGLHANAVRSSGDKTTAPDLRTFDFAGLALLMGAVSCFLAVVQMIQLPQFAKDNFYTLVAVVVALIACSIAFLVTESSMGGNALVPLRLLRPKSLGLFYAAQILYGTGAMAMASSLSDFFVRSRGFTPTQASTCHAPACLGFAAGSITAGRLISRSGRYQRWSIIGFSIFATGSALILMRWTVFEFQTWEMTYLFPTLFGAGVMLCSQFVGVSVAAPEEHEATSFTTFYFSQQIGFMTGTSVTGSLFRVIFEARLKDFSESDSMIRRILDDRQFVNTLPSPLRDQLRSLARKSFLVFPVIASISAVFGLAITIMQEERALEAKKDGVDG